MDPIAELHEQAVITDPVSEFYKRFVKQQKGAVRIGLTTELWTDPVLGLYDKAVLM